MAILTAQTTEDRWERRAQESLQDGITGTRVFKLYSDSMSEDEGAVLAACPVSIGDSFPGTLTCRCVSRTPELASKDDFSQFKVVCEYKSILNQTEQARVDQPNPLDRSAKVQWSSRTVMKAENRLQLATTTGGAVKAYKMFTSDFTFDERPFLVANTARDPFDPPIEVPTTEWIATITKNVTEPPEWLETYENTVNDSDIYVGRRLVKKGCGKMCDLRIGENMQENGTVFCQVQFSIVTAKPRKARSDESVVPEPWDIEVLNEGMRTFGASKWKNIVDQNGQAVSKPVPLDATGAPIAVSGEPIAEADLYWMLFRNCERKNFLTLPGVSATRP